MKLYEINMEIERVIEQFIDTETGEVLGDTAEMQEILDGLQMEKMHILEYLAKLVLNLRSDRNALNDEIKRLAERERRIAAKEERILAILDRECAGEKTDLGVATVGYRKSVATVVDDQDAAVSWLESSGYDDVLKYTAPSVIKSGAKKLLQSGVEIPGIHLEEHNNMNLK